MPVRELFKWIERLLQGAPDAITREDIDYARKLVAKPTWSFGVSRPPLLLGSVFTGIQIAARP